MVSENSDNMNTPCSKKFGFCFFTLIILLIGFLLVNAYYVPGKETTLTTWRQRPVLNVAGYDQISRYCDYKVTGVDENGKKVIPHIQIRADECSEMVVSMQCKAKEDTEVTLRIYKDGFRLQQVDEVCGIWKKGTVNCRLTGIKETGRVYDLYVPADFSLDCLYFANDIDASAFKEKKQMGYVVVLCISLILGLLLGLNKKPRCVINNAKKRIGSGFGNIKHKLINNKSSVVKFGVGIFGAFLVAGLLDFVISKFTVLPFDFEITYVIFCILFFFFYVICFREWITKHVEVTACVLIVLFGSLMLNVKLPTTEVVSDDHTHYGNQYMTVKEICPYTSVSDLRLVYMNAKNPMYDKKRIKDALVEQLDYVDKIGYSYKTELLDDYLSGQFGVKISYLPNRIGLWLGNALGLKYHHRFQMGCISNLIFYLLLVLFSLKKLRYGKYTLMLVSIIPVYIFQATGYTYDVWILGLYTLGFSIFMGRWQQKNTLLKTSELVVICLAMFLFYQPKAVYFFAIFILLFLQKDKFKNKMQRRIYLGILIFAMLFPIIPTIMVRVVRPILEASKPAETQTIHSEMVSGLEYIKNTPLKFMKEWIISIFHFANPISRDYGFFMRFGYYGKAGFDWIISLTLIMSAFLDNNKKDENRYPVYMKIISLLIYFGVVAICTLAMFLEEGSFDAYCGRYILPVLFPTLFMVTRLNVNFKETMESIKGQIHIKAAPAIPVVIIALCAFFTIIKKIILPYMGISVM